MRRIKHVKTFVLAALLGIMIPMMSACSDDENSETVGLGTVTGMIVDDFNDPVSGVTVTITDMEGSETTGSDGKFTFTNVPMDRHAITFTKKGYQTVTATVVASKFNESNVATINVSTIITSAKIMGTILDGKNNDSPLAGVTVSIGALSATSGSDGKFLFEDLAIDEYTVTFTKADYVTIKKDVKKSDFVNETVTMDVRMGSTELLRGMTRDDLTNAQKWYYNEYRGGRNGDAYPHWDWSTNYFYALNSFWGNIEEQNEGTTMRIRNDEADRSNPVDLDVFDSYMYGSKMITDDNKILSLRLRTHGADEASPAYFGVQVIDLAVAEPAAVKVGETKTIGTGNYTDFHFDLSEYVGKEVIIAIGIYRKETGDYWKQLVVRAIRFADTKVEGWGWLPGKEFIEGWQMTEEMVRSTMPHSGTTFTGISPIGANRDNYPDAYVQWRGIGHIAAEWAMVPVFKDPEITPSEGYLLKTRGDGAINTEVPEAYLYAKFAIAAGKNKLSLNTRNFHGEDYTYFKLTAFKEDGTYKHVEPISNTAEKAEAAENGCWKFIHQAGDADNPNDYATFVYDLSEFNGSNVVLALGVFNGERNGTENKLVFRSVTLE
ncbi:carboxypeptidase-like regulatory domain-containing protein [Bacteroides sp. OttesenSCG-928-J23]|nr:carboxypeptidase-like regulatory domain-containing protein [Bacteroides sp. OttesenSCG-928-N06]MDL2247172.1 carboxypeptidase-like regulatory domain-containing protein [Bacteroides sp. OttesenSCG-928-J23]MDL2303908.1 carboxypeptidase-like regulatory domain-containing protein [Bacteroides sp. OttesenSCG-928-D19]